MINPLIPILEYFLILLSILSLIIFFIFSFVFISFFDLNIFLIVLLKKL